VSPHQSTAVRQRESLEHASLKLSTERQPNLLEQRLGRKKAADPRDNNWLAGDHLAGISPDHVDVVAQRGKAAARAMDQWERTEEWHTLQAASELAPFGILDPYADLPRLKRYFWQAATLDQLPTSRCCWFGGEQMLRSGPVTQKEEAIVAAVERLTGVKVPTLEAMRWNGYFWLQDHDEWDGREPTYFGSSERAVGRFMVDGGFTKQGYFWLRTVTEVFRAIMLGYIVGCGSDWFTGMDDPKPDKKGDLFMDVSGTWRGGHFYIFDGGNITALCPDGSVGKLRKHGSWGDQWAHNGSAYLSAAGLDYLIRTGAGLFMIPEVRAA
jgi:hypothetical protein